MACERGDNGLVVSRRRLKLVAAGASSSAFSPAARRLSMSASAAWRFATATHRLTQSCAPSRRSVRARLSAEPASEPFSSDTRSSCCSILLGGPNSKSGLTRGSFSPLRAGLDARETPAAPCRASASPRGRRRRRGRSQAQSRLQPRRAGSQSQARPRPERQSPNSRRAR